MKVGRTFTKEGNRNRKYKKAYLQIKIGNNKKTKVLPITITKHGHRDRRKTKDEQKED